MQIPLSPKTQALAEALAQLAARGETITYGALARDLNLRMAELTAALEDMMAADMAARQPLRAVLCRARLGDGLPAAGFFAHAADLGLLIADEATFVAQERAALFAAAPKSS